MVPHRNEKLNILNMPIFLFLSLSHAFVMCKEFVIRRINEPSLYDGFSPIVIIDSMVFIYYVSGVHLKLTF